MSKHKVKLERNFYKNLLIDRMAWDYDTSNGRQIGPSYEDRARAEARLKKMLNDYLDGDD